MSERTINHDTFKQIIGAETRNCMNIEILNGIIAAIEKNINE